MNTNDIFDDDEILFRRVLVNKPDAHVNDKRYRWNNELEKFEVLPLAFYHNKNRISVDRACNCNNDPSMTQESSLNGVAKLLVKKVEGMNNIYPFKAKIEYEPIENNIAHCVITLQPDDNVLDGKYKEQRMNFRQNLADIANILKLAIDPAY